MPNPFFRFKQFTVYHDRCAMKVGTDGVLIGAWTETDGNERALDIGTGTGLIALMLAQRNSNIKIQSIDIDKEAIAQARDNIKQSPFLNQISCKHIALEDFAKQENTKFDLIVSNPPFFVESLKSPDMQRSLARHTDSLGIEDLIALSATLLSEKGRLSFIYPFDHKDVLLRLAIQNGLFVSRITNVYPIPTAMPKRVLMELSKREKPLIENNLIIEESRHIYTDGFTTLVKDFYLKL